MTKITRDLDKNKPRKLPNPTGKGGFGDRPQDINRTGTWDPTMTFKYQYPYFNNMALDKFKDWIKSNPQRTVIQDIAWRAVAKARLEHKYLTEVANRTEGMPRQSTDLTSNGQTLAGLVQINEADSEEK